MKLNVTVLFVTEPYPFSIVILWIIFIRMNLSQEFVFLKTKITLLYWHTDKHTYVSAVFYFFLFSSHFYKGRMYFYFWTLRHSYTETDWKLYWKRILYWTIFQGLNIPRYKLLPFDIEACTVMFKTLNSLIDQIRGICLDRKDMYMCVAMSGFSV